MKLRNIVLSILISGVSLYFVLRGVDWRQVWTHLSEVNLPLFGVSMLLMLAAYFLMTWRWQHLLDPLELPNQASTAAGSGNPDGQKGVRDHVGLFNLYGKVLTGYFFNAFFPARAGDVVRAYLLGRKTGLTKTTVLATIVVEKAFDGIALLLMLLLSLILLPSGGSSQSQGLALVASVVLVGAVVGLALFYRYSSKIAVIVERILSHLPVPVRIRQLVVRLIEAFAGGMHVFKNPRPLISAAVISLFVWGVVALMFMTALLSFRTAFPTGLVSLPGLLFITALVNLGLLIPALPGNVGTYEALCVAAMAVFRVDKELAVAFALIFHVGQLIVTLLVGVVAFWAQNLSLSEMRPVEATAEREVERSLEEIERASV